MKTKMIFLTLFLLAALILAGCGKEYRIGDTGPAGGIIFFVREGNSVTDEWRYLEAAPQDLPKAQWGLIKIEIGAKGKGIGWGKKNTEHIIEELQKRGEIGRAVQLCVGYSQGGYTDWFLPSKDELNLMYENLHIKRLGGFEGRSEYDHYWSSSEDNNYDAWGQDFRDGRQFSYYDKGRSGYIRAVRAF